MARIKYTPKTNVSEDASEPQEKEQNSLSKDNNTSTCNPSLQDDVVVETTIDVPIPQKTKTNQYPVWHPNIKQNVINLYELEQKWMELSSKSGLTR